MDETLIILQGNLKMSHKTDVRRQKIGAQKPESHLIIRFSFSTLVDDRSMLRQPPQWHYYIQSLILVSLVIKIFPFACIVSL